MNGLRGKKHQRVLIGSIDETSGKKKREMFKEQKAVQEGMYKHAGSKRDMEGSTDNERLCIITGVGVN